MTLIKKIRKGVISLGEKTMSFSWDLLTASFLYATHMANPRNIWKYELKREFQVGGKCRRIDCKLYL